MPQKMIVPRGTAEDQHCCTVRLDDFTAEPVPQQQVSNVAVGTRNS